MRVSVTRNATRSSTRPAVSSAAADSTENAAQSRPQETCRITTLSLVCAFHARCVRKKTKGARIAPFAREPERSTVSRLNVYNGAWCARKPTCNPGAPDAATGSYTSGGRLALG